MSNQPTAYETDFYAWIQEQVRLLDARQFDALDIPHLVEEIASLGKSKRRALCSCLGILLTHLLLHWSMDEVSISAVVPR